MPEPIVTSVYGYAEAEYIVKKSRFIASLQEIKSEEEAATFLEQVKKKHWDARHNCYAWQLGLTGLQQKSNDGGEPAGTAGRPMLEVLKKSGITNTIVVVTRYFGGIKLGASGLIRAYSHAVVLGLEAAQIADYKPYVAANIHFDYTFMNTLERLLPIFDILVTDRNFSDSVQFQIQIPKETVINFETAVADATNGSAVLELHETLAIPIIRNKQ